MYSSDISESMWCNGSILPRNSRDLGLSPALGTLYPIFVTPLVAVTKILYQLCTEWLLNLPCIACVHVIVSIKIIVAYDVVTESVEGRYPVQKVGMLNYSPVNHMTYTMPLFSNIDNGLFHTEMRGLPSVVSH